MCHLLQRLRTHICDVSALKNRLVSREIKPLLCYLIIYFSDWKKAWSKLTWEITEGNFAGNQWDNEIQFSAYPLKKEKFRYVLLTWGKFKKEKVLWFQYTHYCGFSLKRSPCAHVLNTCSLVHGRILKAVEGQRCGRASWQSTSPGVGSWKFVLDPGSSLFTGFLVSCSLCHMRLLSGTPSFLPSLHRWQAYKTVRQNKHIHLRWFLSAILVTATQKASDTCNQIPCQTTANKAAISPMHSGECSG